MAIYFRHGGVCICSSGFSRDNEIKRTGRG